MESRLLKGEQREERSSPIPNQKHSTQQCPGGIKLDIGHSKHKQGKYNSAYCIGFVVYTCLRNVMKDAMKYERYVICYVMPCAIKGLNAMMCHKVNNLLATADARWKGEAWRTVKCGDQAATRFELL
ncbi:hypothetical protein TIFTF001_051856, partial [Ficus carica]